MSMEGVVHCDGPDCQHHQHVSPTATRLRRLPAGWNRLVEYGDSGEQLILEFCSADCVMKKCAELPPPEEIEVGGGSDA